MRHVLSVDQTSGRGRRWLTRGFAISAVVEVAMLGNLRLQAEAATPPQSHRLQDSRFASISHADEIRVDAPGSDDVQLVPALYAWNPDVRFVYFRHVTKWM